MRRSRRIDLRVRYGLRGRDEGSWPIIKVLYNSGNNVDRLGRANGVTKIIAGCEQYHLRSASTSRNRIVQCERSIRAQQDNEVRCERIAEIAPDGLLARSHRTIAEH